MKIDQEYINALTEEYTSGEIDRKEAKTKLAEYAKESFNFDLNKQKSFENMVVQLTEMVQNYKEPELEEQEGLSITDLISASDQLDGKNIFNDANEEALELVKSITPVQETTITEEPKDIKLEVKPVLDVPEVQERQEDLKKEQPIKPITKTQALPDDFSPTITLLGRAPGFYTLPWWIYKWILENEDWKDHPEDCPEYSAINILKSLIYYIKRDGQVRIRETRNSRFYTLT